MNYNVIEKDNKSYIDISSAETPVSKESDVMDLISLCFEQGINRYMLHKDILSEDFFKLSTGLAGIVMQKFVNYRIRAALLVPEEYKFSVRFKELMLELNKGSDFRVFIRRHEAEAWLLS